MNKLNITEYNLLDYSLKLQEAVEKGYRVSDSVDGSPIMVGFVYTATLMKAMIGLISQQTGVTGSQTVLQMPFPFRQM